MLYSTECVMKEREAIHSNHRHNRRTYNSIKGGPKGSPLLLLIKPDRTCKKLLYCLFCY